MQLPESKLTKKQTVKHRFEGFRVDGGHGTLIVTLRHDDQCGNGHNTFTVNAQMLRDGRDWGGSRDDIKDYSPELAKLLKWHGCTSEEPLYYLQNTLFASSYRDCWGRLKGERYNPAKRVTLGSTSYPIKFGALAMAYLEDIQKTGETIEIIEVSHKSEPDTYSSKYTFKGIECEWYQCAFDTIEEAQGFADSANNNGFAIIEIMTSTGKGKTPDFDQARRYAIWEDATEEQLQSKEALQERLPSLMQEFKTMVEAQGMVF